MKHKRHYPIVIFLCLSVLFLSGCTPAAQPAPTSQPIAPAASPTPQQAAATATRTPEPTTEPMSEPSPTQEPTDAPTVDPGYQAILDYFLISAAGRCSKHEDGSPDTLITASCEFDGVSANFDQFGSASKLNGYMDLVQSEYPSGEVQDWVDNCTSSPGGIVITFIEPFDDSAWLIWSINGQNMTGEAIRADGDMDALKTWWETEGMQHPCP